jgi:TRAP-type transport system periplasmic protein
MKTKQVLALLGCILVVILMVTSCTGTPSTSAPATKAPASASQAPAVSQAPAATQAQTNVIKLRFTNYFPPASDQGVLWQNYCKDIETQTNGQVQITYFPGGTLMDGPGTTDGVKSGIVDIGFMTTGHVTGRFPVTDMLTAMSGYPSAWVVSHVADDYYKKYTPKEWNDFKVLAGCGNSPMVIFSNKPINTMADYKGTKCRVLGRQADQAKLLGASPVNIPVGDSFDALSKGVIDNSATSMEAAKTWRLAEACKYCTLTWPVFSPPVYFAIMNKSSWDNLPANVKTVFDKVSADYVEKMAQMSNNADVVGAQYAAQMGMKFIDLTAEEAAKWQAAVAPVTDGYAQDLTTKGYSKEEVQSMIDFIKARQTYWLEQQAKSSVKSPMGPASIRN